ncbi:unnamed protein product [Lymnaea stagnalis]|uniref:Aerolysin-like C-terminal domain-containing protein n=1 Tax=Lymnaea stagnalis TaxID=6523 RepID=A0AAV2IDL1_LYMST
MGSKSRTFDCLYDVKSFVMDSTQREIAFLAHYLGYGWCGGGPNSAIGEGFVRDGDTLRSDLNGIPDGYMKEQRLAMAYGDWGFSIKEITYGDPVVEELKPESIDSGAIYNNDATEVTKSFERSETCVRSVTHTTTSGWKKSHELGLTFSYTPPSLTGGPGGSIAYKFNYESSKTTTDETNNQQSNTFSINSSKTLRPYSAVKWDLMVSKTKTTVPYTAVILMKFSTELQGFLRWGGGPANPGTNYHYQFRGSGKRPTFNFRFGDGQVPFYTALKRSNETNSRPWLWRDMEHAYPDAQDRINALINEDRFVFTLTGRFEDVVGKKVDIHWDTIPLVLHNAEQ